MSAADRVRRRVVVATADTITQRMAGPAIRAWQLASVLAADHEVRLLTTSKADLRDPRFTVESVDERGLAAAEAWCDVFVFQGWVLAGRGILQRSDKVFVADVYDPLHLEQLEQARDEGEEQRREVVQSANAVLNEQLLRADLLLCASEKQRDFWLGALASLGRVNPVTYDDDETMASLVAVVPFGLGDEPPVRTRRAVKGVLPGIAEDDWVILWGGGIYNWFDPLTLLHAVDRLRRTHDDVRLLFMGVQHPNPDIPEMRMAVDARALTKELGLEQHVVFNEEWVAYDDRQNFLLDADIGVSTHLDHVEAAFSFRTRVLDYIWADLPVVATEGDALADVIDARDLGLTVPAGDVGALADALGRMRTDAALVANCRANAAAVAPELRWSSVTAPLVAFCNAPRRAPDLLDEHIGPQLGARLLAIRQSIPHHRWSAADDLRRARDYLRQGGPGLLVRRIGARARRLWRDRVRPNRDA